jgi:hypothetical protein
MFSICRSNINPTNRLKTFLDKIKTLNSDSTNLPSDPHTPAIISRAYNEAIETANTMDGGELVVSNSL